MAMVSLICPSCGAPVMMPFGKRVCICEYCGAPVKEEMSEAEIAGVQKNEEFVDAIKAAMHCICTRDYETAREYADKAAALLHDDPAPVMIKYISWLNADYRKATSFLTIANSKRDSGSVAISDDEYKGLLVTYADNYLVEKDQDLKRMFSTNRRLKPVDIQNVRQYENLKRIGLYASDPELKTAFKERCEGLLGECESKLAVSNSLSQSEWDILTDVRNNYLFKAAATLFVDAAFSKRCVDLFTKYNNALNQKWENVFKHGQVSGDKDQVRNYRGEAETLISWARGVR